jgi:polyisoprenoid-binding protein YceI
VIASAILALTFLADPVHSSANFTAVHLGISHVSGIIPIKSASVEMNESTNIPTSAKATLDPAGVDTRNDMRDGDLKSPHFFDAATYPAMSFTSTKITATDATHFAMIGDLTMHGQTHPVTLQCEYLGRMTDRRSHTHVAFTAKTTIDRTLWGMTYGNPVVGNSIDLELDIEATSGP